MTSARRGLTLIEALAATILLAMIVGACVPLIALASDMPYGPRIDPGIVAMLADRIAHEPERFEITGARIGVVEIAWPEDLATGADGTKLSLPRATAEALHAAAPESPHIKEGNGRADAADKPKDVECWIVVRAGDAVAQRWARLPLKPRRRVRRANAARRGLTLIETTLALAITSALAVAAFAWTATAARAASIASERSRRFADSESILRLLADDLATLDVGQARDGKKDARVEVRDGALVLHTRSSGAVMRQYQFDAAARTLSVRDQTIDRSESKSILARNVTTWRVALRAREGTLVVSVATEGAEPVTRTFSIGAAP